MVPKSTKKYLNVPKIRPEHRRLFFPDTMYHMNTTC